MNSRSEMQQIDPAIRSHGERGSALLIVFMFAAVVAIMLYRELPVVAFEAQRQKEQMLIDRGNEYKRGVKLFYKKFGMYPGSIEQLEDTNRMRFLRHKYKDPFTGKDDWRLLHMGPGGMLLDSKVPITNTNQLANAVGLGGTSNAPANTGFGANTNATGTSGFGASSNTFGSSGFGASSSSFGSSGFGGSSNTFGNSRFGASSNAAASSGFGASSNSGSNQWFNATSQAFNGSGQTNNAGAVNNTGAPVASGTNTSNDPNAVMVAPLPRRPPAMLATINPKAAGGAEQDGGAMGGDPNQIVQPIDSGDISAGGQGAAPTGQPGVPNGQPGVQNGQPGLQDPNAVNPNGPGSPNSNGLQPGTNQIGANGGTQSANGMNTIRQMLTNPNAQTQSSAFGSSNGNTRGGGLAGVASKAQGHTIKVVNDQVNYSLWEFYYDPNKDVKQGLPGGGINLGGAQGPASGFGAGANGGNAANGANSGTTSFGATQSGFGSSQNGFGSSGQNGANANAGATNPNSATGNSASNNAGANPPQ